MPDQIYITAPGVTHKGQALAMNSWVPVDGNPVDDAAAERLVALGVARYETGGVVTDPVLAIVGDAPPLSEADAERLINGEIVVDGDDALHD